MSTTPYTDTITSDTNGSTAAGIAQCQANPSSCNIDVTTEIPSTITANLDISLPSLNYTTLLGTQNIWADFNFSHEEKGKFYWSLKDYGVNN